ncbi:zinc ribbon domain-containing protein [Haloarcula salinisoli]|uniref:Zinc-ribbon domain-containing protein n=1 Tax=Haloarcula salinisoli TaxID=2487746 RepID=A0A8J8C7Z4_9EURY|nr:zinc ribbon domain-containing protein [Halomicroarcula salinisoli]MBX0303807.1 hypothetical protein [Halomicroarcula salinisoli]
MSDRPPAEELRRSVAVLATEWWLVGGVLAGYVTYGVWVIGTGIALDAFAPALATTSLTTVGQTAVTGLVVLAAVAWLLVPAVGAAWLLDRQLSNLSGNLVSQYSIDHPGVLPAPSGVLMLLAGAAALAVGPRTPVLVVMTVASVHLLVRTVAFGRRVYSFSYRPLFTALSAVSTAAFAAAWLVQAPGLPGPVGTRVTDAGVGTVVETGLGAAGIAPGTATGYLVAVPALLSGLYLVTQAVLARRIRAKAPLANPVKRAEQRYPIMPPVADSSRPGPPEPSTNGASAAATTDSPSTDAKSTEKQSSGATANTTEDSSHTRVFTTDEPIPDDDEAMAAVRGEREEQEDDGWIDDTAIFSPDGATSSDDECGSCGEEIPRESVTFCPNCGERIRR